MRYNYRMDIFNALRDLGYEGHLNKDGPDDIDNFIDGALMDLYKRHSIREIEAMLPVTYHAIRVHLKSLGISLRKPGGPNNYRHGRYVKRKDNEDANSEAKNSTTYRT